MILPKRENERPTKAKTEIAPMRDYCGYTDRYAQLGKRRKELINITF